MTNQPRHNSLVMNDFKLEDEEDANIDLSDFRNELDLKYGNGFYKGQTLRTRVNPHSNRSRQFPNDFFNETADPSHGFESALRKFNIAPMSYRQN